MAWLRGLLRDLAGQGRTILVSSHVLSEVAQSADHVVIVASGRWRYAGPLGLALLRRYQRLAQRFVAAVPEPGTGTVGGNLHAFAGVAGFPGRLAADGRRADQ